eukprot:436280-Rhodomonas_salina.2
MASGGSMRSWSRWQQHRLTRQRQQNIPRTGEEQFGYFQQYVTKVAAPRFGASARETSCAAELGCAVQRRDVSTAAATSSIRPAVCEWPVCPPTLSSLHQRDVHISSSGGRSRCGSRTTIDCSRPCRSGRQQTNPRPLTLISHLYTLNPKPSTQP